MAKPVPGMPGFVYFDRKDLTPEQRAEWDREEAKWKSLYEQDRRLNPAREVIDHLNAVREGLRPPDWQKRERDKRQEVQQERVTARSWIEAEAKRMKVAGEIPDGITKFARTLEVRMYQAAMIDPSIRRVRWTYIKNNLPKWNLWPASKISR
jgi:hypothetical protein